ncbi:MAG: two-component system, OmpR family, alkaline phosphatase synthesis response regulator PhoP [Bacteroidetes bacterium]|nr:MAG: two-component system, OmpR family, alkaline phosphatase synthesis response regulator PhoP [Bacteroidota bacterium]
MLLVDDDEHILLSLKGIFEDAGYEVVCAESGREAIDIAKKFQPHLVILDVIMPGMDGIEVCHELRQVATLQKTLIAFYTARAEDYSQIAGFSAGADDYIIKPLKANVLVSRIKALIKRFKVKEIALNTQAGPIRIDRERYLVFKDNTEIILPRKEFELLALLLSTPRKVFTRDEIYQEIWGGPFDDNNRTIDVHVRKLREKIGDQYIKTVKGIGYGFEAA